MNKKNVKRLLSIVITIAMAMFTATAVFASGPQTFGAPMSALAGAQITDIYSSWAEGDVYMAQHVYGLGAEGTYSNYRGGLSAQKFAPVFESLGAALKADSAAYDVTGSGAGALLTREQVVESLYSLLPGSGAGGAGGAVDYFVDAGILLGRAGGDLQLSEICTVEEMLSLAARVYDHAIYEAGNYSTGFFWVVEGAANTVYLLGSIHLSDESMYPMSKPIEVAFAGSSNLVVEADIAEVSEEDTALIMGMGYLDPSEGVTIADFLTAETYALYVDVCEALGMPAEFYDYIQPWMANNFLTAYLMSAGDAQAMEESSAMGIDMYFLQKAYASGKNLLQLESIQFQMELFASYSYELQEMLLLELLNTALPPADGDGGDDSGSSDDGHGQATDLSVLLQAALEAVKAGDEETLILLFGIDMEYDDPLLIEYNNKMFLERDIGMTEKIVGFLEDGVDRGDYFIVVGAAHYLSKTGVVAQLSELGYEVTRVK
ncbi:MAG: TraB/GumN family protein [Oscillospiraceae bacterium]|nr:TraB/GumN family protein [Oscillospiraceae bacterium]